MCVSFLTIITPLCSFSQSESLKVINKPALLTMASKQDSMFRMVSLTRIAPGIVIDLRYATRQNFTERKLYRNSDDTYLRLPAARAIEEVQKVLAAKGLGLKIWDAYRPYSVTQRMWKLIQDERYVAHPSKGSGHNRGISVDLTIIDLHTGEELDMGTPFDHFSEAAHHDFKNLTADQQKNRTLLKTVMEQHGFKALATEWWHYSWPDPINFPVMDLSFRQLERLTN